jgi:hypothetical protein
MPIPHYKSGPDSYQVSALVLDGQLVIPTSANATTVMPSGVGAVNVLGVAGNAASPIVSQASFVDANAGNAPLVDLSVLPDYTAVYHGPADIRVTYEAACNFGALLMSAATAGQVKPYVAGTPDQIIGRCTQPGGVLAGATVARMRLFG